VTFPEFEFLNSLLKRLPSSARHDSKTVVSLGEYSFPIHTIAFGSKEPSAPTLALTGGMHGQEKIGSQVVLSALETLIELLEWDELTHLALEKSRIVFLPILNPVGMYLLKRGNGNGVDLNRNAPLDADSHSYPLLGGQTISPLIPWYRGDPNSMDFISREVFPAKASIVLDCHSGYGTMDRLWFPHAHTFKPFPHLAEAFALKNLLDNTYPNHVYIMEPSAQGYTMSGDILDYLYLEHSKFKDPKKVFLPITLEMGSWLWLKKNPVQIFSGMGIFNPMHLHRHKRVLRRHITLIEFLHKAVINHQHWALLGRAEREDLHKGAIDYWYSEE
jgi:predicted deacylase